MLVRSHGLRNALAFMRVLSQKHPGDNRRLELLILATVPILLAKGRGRAMVQHLYEWAAERGYKAVVLESAKAPPAYDFYLREGFVVEKEVDLPNGVLCYMRRELGVETQPTD